MRFVRNGEEWNSHKTVWFEGDLQLASIGTNNVMEDELNSGLGYVMVKFDNLENTCKIGVKLYRRVWRTMWSEWLDWIELRTQSNEFIMLIWV